MTSACQSVGFERLGPPWTRASPAQCTVSLGGLARVQRLLWALRLCASHGLPGAVPQRGHSESPALLPTLASPTLHLQLLQGPVPVVRLLTCYRKHFPCFLHVECDMGSDLLFCEQIVFLDDCRVRNQDVCSAPGCTKRAALQGPGCWGLSDTCIF